LERSPNLAAARRGGRELLLLFQGEEEKGSREMFSARENQRKENEREKRERLLS